MSLGTHGAITTTGPVDHAGERPVTGGDSRALASAPLEDPPQPGLSRFQNPPAAMGHQRSVQHSYGNTITELRKTLLVVRTKAIMREKAVLKSLGTYPAVQHGLKIILLGGGKK